MFTQNTVLNSLHQHMGRPWNTCSVATRRGLVDRAASSSPSGFAGVLGPLLVPVPLRCLSSTSSGQLNSHSVATCQPYSKQYDKQLYLCRMQGLRSRTCGIGDETVHITNGHKPNGNCPATMDVLPSRRVLAKVAKYQRFARFRLSSATSKSQLRHAPHDVHCSQIVTTGCALPCQSTGSL